MDSDGLPLIGTGIDLHRVDPLNQRQTLANVNHFIVRTAQFLNKFISVCEEKMEVLSIRLQQLEISMNILETKLSSIPGLDDVQVPSSSTVSTSAPISQSAISQPATTVTIPDQPVKNISDTPTEDLPLPTEPTEEANNSGMIVASKQKDYAQFFRLLQLGVPSVALKQKMIIQGLNPDILDTPNALVPLNGANTSSQENVKNNEKNDTDSEKSESSDSDASFSD